MSADNEDRRKARVARLSATELRQLIAEAVDFDFDDMTIGALEAGIEAIESLPALNAEIVRLRGWFDASRAPSNMSDDHDDAAGDDADDIAPAMPNGVEDMHDDLSTPDLLNEAERIAVNQHKDGRYAAARILRILCHRLRAADNRDAAGVEPVCPATGCGAQVLYECPACSHHNYPPRDTPAAVPAGEAVADDEVAADNAKAADSACLLAIANGYAWDGAAWVKPPTPPAPVQAAPQEGEAMDRGPWRRKGARFYSDDFTRDVSLVVGGDFGSDEVEDRYLDWLLSVLNGPAGAALQHRGDSRGGEATP